MNPKALNSNHQKRAKIPKQMIGLISVESVQDWLTDIEMKWTGIYRGITQRFFSSAIAHSTPDEQTQIYKLLLNNSFTKEWAKTLIEQEMNYDF